MAEAITNLAINTQYVLNIEQLPIVSSQATNVTIPSLTINQAQYPNRYIDYPMPGEKIEYSQLEVSFIVDEKLDSYAEVYNWMNKMATSVTDAEERELIFCDTTLTLIGNDGNDTRKFIFSDCWPGFLSETLLDTAGNSGAVENSITIYFTNMRIVDPTIDTTGFYNYQYKTEIS